MVVAIIIALVLIALFWGSIHLVPENMNGLVLRFGKYMRTVDSGVHFTIPFLDTIDKINLQRQQETIELAYHPNDEDEEPYGLCLIVLDYEKVDAEKASFECPPVYELCEDYLFNKFHQRFKDVRDNQSKLDSAELSSYQKELNGLFTKNSSQWGLMVYGVTVSPP